MTLVHDHSTTQDKVDWTIMLFIAADGVLANFAVDSLQQLEKPASRPDGSKSTAGELDGANVKLNVIPGVHFAFPTKQVSVSGTDTKAKGGGDHRTKNKASLAPKLASMLVKSPETTNMSQKEALECFLRSASKDPRFEAKHYALILWGHGPELLLQPAASDQTDGSNGMYITPEELREVLEAWSKDGGPKLDIIGFDACFMSMLEMAYEIRDRAHYMVASQDEVPDASFPYAKLLELFRKHPDNAESLLKDGVDEYLDTYGEYIFGESTGLNPVTLSVLRLDKCAGLKEAVDGLATVLVDARCGPGIAKKLIEARNCSKDYAGGLYVDLYEFCSNLSTQGVNNDVNDACAKVTNALGPSSDLILKNRSADERSHGISIYLPYLTEDQYAKVNWPLVKGGHGTGGAKGFSDALNGATVEYLMDARRSLILDTESYYRDLQLVSETNDATPKTNKSWYDFITDVWTNVLIQTVPAALDFHYSTQQSWMNVNRKSIDIPQSRENSESPTTRRPPDRVTHAAA